MTKLRLVGTVSGILVAFVWMVLRSGTGILPGHDQVVAAAVLWPERVSASFQGFLADSPLNLIAFKLLGFENSQELLWLSLTFIVISITLLAAWAGKTSDRGRARAIRLAILAPISTVMLHWIGSYDPFTMFCWGIVLFAWISHRRWIMVLSAIPLGFQHFEHGILGLLVLILVWNATHNALPLSLSMNPAWFIPGVVSGKLLLTVMFIWAQQPFSGRSEWIGPFLREWTVIGINIAPMLLWSLFAGSWAVVLFAWLHVQGRGRIQLALAFLIGLGALALSGDRPRVFIIVTAPALLLLVIYFSRKAKGREATLIESIVWLAPPVIFWGKEVANENAVDLIVIAWKVLTQ